MDAMERRVWGKRGEPTVSKATSTPRSSVRASTISEKSSSPVGMTSDGAEGLQGRGLGFVGGDGENAGAFELGELDQVRSQSAAGAGDEDCFVRLNLGLFHGLDGNADGAGEEAGLGPGDSVGNFDEAAFPHRQSVWAMPPFMPWPMAWASGQRRSRPWAHQRHRPQASVRRQTTGSPGRTVVTRRPTSVTTPATSWPGMRGVWTPRRRVPSITSRSWWQKPQAAT